jgi:hypothetical protein
MQPRHHRRLTVTFLFSPRLGLVPVSHALELQLRDFLLGSEYCETDGFTESHGPIWKYTQRMALSSDDLRHRHACHASTATASHEAAARTRAQAGDCTIISQITRPKAASPKLPSAAPAASRAAASLPRRAPGRPASSLRSRTCFFDQCRACGKDRGKGEKQAANDGSEAGRDKACDHGHRPAELTRYSYQRV